MTIKEILSKAVSPLRPGDSVEHALDVLNEVQSTTLPVVGEGGMLVGMVSQGQMEEAPDDDLHLDVFIGGPKPITARPDTHVFDATKLMVANRLHTLIVTDEVGHYLGSVERKDLFEQFAWMLATHEHGAILTLEIAARDYALSKLIYLIEQSDAKVLSVSSERLNDEDGTLRVTLKLDSVDTIRIRHVLEHHGYRVVDAHTQDYYDEELQLRVQEFMRYLEV